MQGNNGQQGNQGAGQKSGGLSWSQSAPQHSGSSSSSAPAAKPVQAAVSATPSKPAAVPPPAKSGGGAAQQKQPGSRLVGVFISGVIVGLVIGWGWSSLRTNDDAANNMNASTTKQGAGVTPSKNTTDTTPGAAAPTTGAVSNGALSVSSLQSAGLSVAVSNISVAVPTWVVIMDNNNGTPGNALGAQMFFPGEKSGSVDLLRATVSGKSYLVAEYVDDGDHKFSKQIDAQVTGISGAPTLVEFTVR